MKISRLARALLACSILTIGVAACSDDSQCEGNPCFEDVSGQRFCGAPWP